MNKIVSTAVFLLTLSCAANTSSEVQKSVLSGRWYPADRGELSATVDSLLSKAGSLKYPIKPVLLIVPHAGYAYSGAVAAAGFNTLKKLNPDLIVILAPSHYSRFHGCAVLSADYYETPLGRVKIESDIAKILLKDKMFTASSYAFMEEHAAEIQIPFIQRIFGNSPGNKMPLLVILVGEIDSKDAASAAGTLCRAIAGKKDPLFIISSDFTHYGVRFGYLPFTATNNIALKQKLEGLDSGAINFILKKDREGFMGYCSKTGATICGKNPIMLGLSLPVKDFKAKLISYDTSGNITGDFLNSVSYAAVAVEGVLQHPAAKTRE